MHAMGVFYHYRLYALLVVQHFVGYLQHGVGYRVQNHLSVTRMSKSGAMLPRHATTSQGRPLLLYVDHLRATPF